MSHAARPTTPETPRTPGPSRRPRPARSTSVRSRVAVRRSLNGDHVGEAGTMLPPLVDHHVHLMIVGVDALGDSAIAGIVDLGAPLDLVAARRHRDGLPRADYAGTFLTAPGGYPVGRPWAPAGASARSGPNRRRQAFGAAECRRDGSERAAGVRGIRHQGRPQRRRRDRCFDPRHTRRDRRRARTSAACPSSRTSRATG